MFRHFIIIILFIFACKVNAQSGFGPVTSCSFPIPEICPNAFYPSSTTGTATAPGGSFLCPGSSNGISMNPSFFYFEAGASGSIDILIEPIDLKRIRLASNQPPLAVKAVPSFLIPGLNCALIKGIRKTSKRNFKY